LIAYAQCCGVLPHSEQHAEPAEREITVTELKAKLDRREPLQLIDGRDLHEWQIWNLAADGATLLPLGQLASRMQALDSAEEIGVHCKMGGRSAEAYARLKQAGFPRIKNLRGSILAWADQVDHTMPKY
jgi:adenylyltransferase/sulfurtransferase